ncbi:MAG: translation elongation factor Ts [Chloroflexi bacterium]|uniref:translation elongation factor Ts n=1 Tax=Candidatus Flexifilum breve TaxID=3140694 RepID=UPI0031347123|nr:translation elongation factor Ts [Chloroflexota bacterium]MBK9749319.1 translation elongation factor Ts [Chloroflexota bacterium]
MAITAQQVKDLREMTGAGPLDCKKALESTNGDVEKAAAFLREKGLAKAAKKLNAGRSMNEGLIESYLHFTKRLGVMVEVNCETDFVANTDAFKKFAKEVALHIANLNPQYVKREDVPADLVESERQVLLARTLNEGKKPEVAEKIVAGRLDKFYQDIVLMEQPWLKDDNKTISQLLAETVAEVGESIEIRRFARFEISTPVDVPE